MRQYLDLLRDIMDNGHDRSDRTGTGVRSVFGRQMRVDLADGFPLLTTKKLHVRSIVIELLWFVRGDTNVGWLHEHGVRIWDEWADANGDLGPVYGKQWRCWNGPDGRQIDQLGDVRDELIRNPDSRRLVVCAWNPAEIAAMALPPCHCLFQFQVSGGRLNCLCFQRSADVFLGLPFNMASYALLTMLMARAAGLEPGEVVYSLGDAHLYANHMTQAREQLTRSVRAPPTLTLSPGKTDLFGWCYDDLALHGYDPHPHIGAPVAV